jgi:putative hydroxymethylpyrimidine transport system ATP-binding protein
MLKFKDVIFTYKGNSEPIIKGLNLQVERGEFVSIIGASGCGKSTIFRLINSLETPQEGEITIDDKDINNIKHYSAYMPQKDLLIPWRTILQNIALPLEIQGLKKDEIHDKCEAMLKEVNLLEYKDKFPKDLSGGMKQRVSFIRTLLTGSELLLLDEPFSALDALTRISMQEWLLSQWKHFNKTIIFITHDVEEALFLSNRILMVQDKPINDLEEISVPMDYPRKRDFMHREDIITLKENLINKLKEKVQI